MDGWKSWLTSKTLWGILVGLIIALGGLFGYSFSEVDKVDMETALSGIGTGVALLFAAFGRIKATKQIGSGSVEIDRDTGLPRK